LREESKGPERARPSPISLFTGLDEKLFFKALGINEIGEICPKGNSTTQLQCFRYDEEERLLQFVQKTATIFFSKKKFYF
jgi:hypothetical protein